MSAAPEAPVVLVVPAPAAPVVLVAVALVEPVAPASSEAVVDVVLLVPNINCRAGGNWTGLRNTMMQASTTRQAPATLSSFLFRSTAPNRAARKKPLRRKNNAMLTELLTRPAYQTPHR